MDGKGLDDPFLLGVSRPNFSGVNLLFKLPGLVGSAPRAEKVESLWIWGPLWIDRRWSGLWVGFGGGKVLVFG